MFRILPAYFCCIRHYRQEDQVDIGQVLPACDSAIYLLLDLGCDIYGADCSQHLRSGSRYMEGRSMDSYLNLQRVDFALVCSV